MADQPARPNAPDSNNGPHDEFTITMSGAVTDALKQSKIIFSGEDFSLDGETAMWESKYTEYLVSSELVRYAFDKMARRLQGMEMQDTYLPHRIASEMARALADLPEELVDMPPGLQQAVEHYRQIQGDSNEKREALTACADLLLPAATQVAQAADEYLDRRIAMPDTKWQRITRRPEIPRGGIA